METDLQSIEENDMTKKTLSIALGALLSVSAAGFLPQVAQAGLDASSWQDVSFLPYRGMYYEVGHGGTGLTLDVDGTGFVFAQFYAYDADGSQRYYLIEGRYVPERADRHFRTGQPIGTLDAQAYVTANGQCVHVGCSYRNPDRMAPTQPVAVHIEWHEPRRARVQIGAQSWEMEAGRLTESREQMAEGQWAASYLSWQPDRQRKRRQNDTLYPVKIKLSDLKHTNFGSCASYQNPPQVVVDSAMDIPEDAEIYTVDYGGSPSDYLFYTAQTNAWWIVRATRCDQRYKRTLSAPWWAERVHFTADGQFVAHIWAVDREDGPEDRYLGVRTFLRVPPGSMDP